MPKDARNFKEESTSRVLETLPFASNAETLAWKTSDEQTKIGEVTSFDFSDVAVVFVIEVSFIYLDCIFVDFGITHTMRCSRVMVPVRQLERVSFRRVNSFPLLGLQSFPFSIICFRILFATSDLVSVSDIHIGLYKSELEAADTGKETKVPHRLRC